MSNKIDNYRDKLAAEVERYADKPLSFRALQEISCICECLEHLGRIEHKGKTAAFTRTDAAEWCAQMENDDGTTGGHWTIDQTTPLAAATGISFEVDFTPSDWNVALNMIYSDYCKVAEKHGTNKLDWYADMAKAFLFDRDGGGPEKKLSKYYNNVVK